MGETVYRRTGRSACGRAGGGGLANAECGMRSAELKRSQFIMFFAIVVTLWTLIQLYIGFTLVPGVIAPVPGPIGVSLLAVLPIAVMFVGRTNRRVPFKDALEWIGVTTRGVSA